jgi:beta-galactosidase
MQGFGQLIYLNSTYPLESIMGGLFPPRVSHENNPVGSYHRTFTVPEDWDGRQVLIHFESVKSAFYIWVNGQKVGYSEGSFTPAEFNLTPHLKEGKNTLAIEVYRWSDGSWLEDQDMWRFSGIIRSVYLYSRPNLHLQDFFVRSGLDENYRDGDLHITAAVRNNTGEGTAPPTVEAYLYDQDGNRLGDGPVARAETEHGMPAGTQSLAELRATIENPQKWTAETPNLYTVVVVLRDADGNVVDVTRTNTGFREIEILDDMFMVNGKEVKLKGANLHDHDPETGRTVDFETMVRDVKLMKQNNFNAVRMAHYPHNRKYYELFDKYGLYVMDEANVETHGISFRRNLIPGSDPLWTDAVIDRARSMVEANKNYPSIVIWSLGNEAGNGTNFKQMASYVRKADPTRLIHYQHMFEVADMASYMYPSVGFLQRALNDPDIDQPIILCEYVHSMGNSTGNLDEYMNLMENNRNFIGAFVWDWVDQGLWKESDQGEKYWAYGGDYGDQPNDGNFNFNGLIFADRKPQPALKKVKYSYQPVEVSPINLQEGWIWVSNNYSHKRLEDHYLEWSLTEDGKSIQSGRIDDLEIEAGESDRISLPVESPDLQPGREYFLNVSFHLKNSTRWADEGFKAAWEQMKVPYAVAKAQQMTLQDSETLNATETDTEVEVGNSSFNLLISKETGALENYQYGDNSLISSSLEPNFWRAPTDNDEAGWGESIDPWKNAGENRTVTSVVIDELSDQRVEVTVKGNLPVGESTYQTIYTILGNGVVHVDQSVTPIGTNIPSVIPKVGMEVRIPKDYKTMTWFGRGPEENYSDRKTGITVGRYSGLIDSLWTNYPVPQENGNRSDVRWVAFTDANGNGFLAVAESTLSVSAWPNSVEDLEQATHIHELPRRNYYTVNLDYKQQGVGGTNSWDSNARPLPAYRLPTSKSYNYQYYLRPVTSGSGDLGDLANQSFSE